MPNNMEEILSRQISGFHQYCLTEPVHLTYVSRNLCDMVGCSENDLLDSSRDCFAPLVHPSDRDRYTAFLQQLRKKEQTLTLEYRLLKADGRESYVRDTCTSQRETDGSFTAVSVLTDISDLKKENQSLHLLNETFPCGILRYTCEKQPRVTYINQKMMDILRFPGASDNDSDGLEMLKNNIFLMIPIEERRRFSKYLDRVSCANTPVVGEMEMLRCDGTRAYVFGWVIRTVNEQGAPEFQSICMDYTEQHQAKKNSETQRYLQGLADVYDKIFEFNLDAGTVKCLHCDASSSFQQLKGIAVQTEDALEKWLLDPVDAADREPVRSFFRVFLQKEPRLPDAKPPQVTYCARSSDGTMKQYTGIFIKINESVSFFCCRAVQHTSDASALKSENTRLREGMRDIIQQFSDGIAAFEVTPEACVKPLYASENVCDFFGYSEEAWLPLTEKFTPLEEFVRYCDVTRDKFDALLRKGEAEFSYFDYKTGTERKIKAVFSQKELSKNASRYILLYAVDENHRRKNTGLAEVSPVFIRTFGYFDVFVDGKPIAFSNKKAKELLALLVDRKGGFITSEEAIGFLWEDEPANSVTYARYRKVALRLKNTLEEYGIANIMETVDGKRRIVMEEVQCDLYDYLSGDQHHSQLFKGSYLTNYSWAEVTLGELIGNLE